MQKISIGIGRHITAEVDAEILGDSPLTIQIFENLSLANLIESSKAGLLSTTLHGKRYKILALQADGKCTLEPE